METNLLGSVYPMRLGKELDFGLCEAQSRGGRRIGWQSQARYLALSFSVRTSGLDFKALNALFQLAHRLVDLSAKVSRISRLKAGCVRLSVATAAAQGTVLGCPSSRFWDKSSVHHLESAILVGVWPLRAGIQRALSIL